MPIIKITEKTYSSLILSVNIDLTSSDRLEKLKASHSVLFQHMMFRVSEFTDKPPKKSQPSRVTTASSTATVVQNTPDTTFATTTNSVENDDATARDVENTSL